VSQRRRFEVKCTDCNKVTIIFFKPTIGRPIYCRECLSKHRPNRSKSSHRSLKFDFSNIWAIRRDDYPRRKSKSKSVSKR
jgi:CxxC-x17-CxxC domain-containing protein